MLLQAGTEEGCVVLFLYTGEGFEYMKSLQKQEGRLCSTCIDEGRVGSHS